MKRLLKWKWLVRCLLVLLVLIPVLLVSVRYVIRYQGRSRLAETVRQVDERDPGWTADQVFVHHNSRLPSPERNSFPVVEAAYKLVPAEFASRKDVPDTFGQRTSNTLLRADERDAIDRQLLECDEAIKTARSLIDYADGGRRIEPPESPFDIDLGPIQNVRTVTWLLQLDSIRVANDNRAGDGIRGVRAALNAARSIGDDPNDLSQLVRSACAVIACRTAEQVLGVGETADGLTELQSELLREADFPRVTVTFRSQRAAVHQLFQLLETGDVAKMVGKTGASEVKYGPGSGVTLWGLRTFTPDDHAFSIELLTTCTEIGRKPFDRQWNELKSIPKPRGPDVRHIYSSLFLPAIHKLGEGALRSRGELLATAVAIACERHRLRTGRWPDSLDEIPKDILPAIPNDPFTGRRIRFKRSPDGVVVYSVGPDEKDDGGQLTDTASTLYKPRDFGIRLWDPARRRQPAPPPEPKEFEEGM